MGSMSSDAAYCSTAAAFERSNEVQATRSVQGNRLASRYSCLLRDTPSTKCCRLASRITIAFPIPCDAPVTSTRALSPSPIGLPECRLWKSNDRLDPFHFLTLWGKHDAHSFGKFSQSQLPMGYIG